jgi:hypothetical protein
MSEGIRMAFQGDQRSRIPGSNITQNNGSICRFGNLGAHAGNGLNPVPVILDVAGRQLGRGKRAILRPEIRNPGGKPKLRGYEQAPKEVSCGEKKSDRQNGSGDPEDGPADPPGIGKDGLAGLG